MVQQELPIVSQGTNERKKNYNMVPLIVSILACLSPTTPTGNPLPLSHV